MDDTPQPYEGYLAILEYAELNVQTYTLRTLILLVQQSVNINTRFNQNVKFDPTQLMYALELYIP